MGLPVTITTTGLPYPNKEYSLFLIGLGLANLVPAQWAIQWGHMDLLHTKIGKFQT